MATKTTKQAPIVEVLPPEPAEVALVLQESVGLVTWFGQLAQFFGTAKQLEAAAVARRDRVLALKVPTTKVDDAAMRQEALDARGAKKIAQSHWEPVTSVLSRLHKRATSGRAAAVDPLEEAEKFATRQHDAFETAERRRAEEEQARIRREEENLAEAKRVQALREFEAAAQRAEDASPDLSAREAKFVERYSGLNADGTRLGAPVEAWLAAAAAGYKNVNDQAALLIASDKIRAAIEARQRAHAMRAQIAIMQEIAPAVDEAKIAAAGPNLNSGDSKSWTAIVDDPARLRDAAFERPELGIPRELFVIDNAVLQRYARSLEQRIEAWPSVRAIKKTTIRG